MKIPMVTMAVLLIVSCAPQNSMTLELMKSDYDVLVSYDSTSNQVFAVRTPIKVLVYNEIAARQTFIEFDPYHQESALESRPGRWWLAPGSTTVDLYYPQKDSLIWISSGKRSDRYRTLRPFGERTYLIYWVHLVDTTRYAQSLFTPYLKRAAKEGTRPIPRGLREGVTYNPLLSIGTVEQLMQTDPLLFKDVFAGDSISIFLGRRRVKGIKRNAYTPFVPVEIPGILAE